MIVHELELITSKVPEDACIEFKVAGKEVKVKYASVCRSGDDLPTLVFYLE